MVDLSPRAHRIQIIAGSIVAILFFTALIAIPRYLEPKLTQLESIQQRGVLKILTLNAASTYYQDANGANGFEYQLAKIFAEYIDVDLKMIVVDQFSDLYPELVFGSGDIIAAGVSNQDSTNNARIDYSVNYHHVTQQLLYRKGQHPRVKKLEDLNTGILEVINGTSHARLLTSLKNKYPDLSWIINNDIGVEELIELVDEGLVDYILADSHEVALQRRFYPELRVALELGKAKQLRWAVKSSEDRSLIKQINKFFELIKKDGRLDQLIHRHYSHVAKFNYSDIQTFTAHARDRLPKYREFFQREASAQGLDWRLLAAIGYQESLWNPKAKSPTGVRGLMMLTLNTAKHVKIKNRLDPAQSIKGGAIYFKKVLNKIPERIKQPDRTWFALASYNVGFGHLEDARKITQGNQGDPDKWIDIKKSLPLLSRKKWYKFTKHGYARGSEPVKYVENIRKYYDLLKWMDARENGEPKKELLPAETEPLSIPPSF